VRHSPCPDLQADRIPADICDREAGGGTALPARRNVLDIVRRPEALRRRLVAFVEEGLEGAQDDLHGVGHRRASSISLMIGDAGRELSTALDSPAKPLPLRNVCHRTTAHRASASKNAPPIRLPRRLLTFQVELNSATLSRGPVQLIQKSFRYHFVGKENLLVLGSFPDVSRTSARRKSTTRRRDRFD
jgi:hypothetical protein